LDKSGVHDRDLSEEEGVVSQGWGSGHRRGAFRKYHTKSMQVHDLVRGILNRRGVRQPSFFRWYLGAGNPRGFGRYSWPNTRDVLGSRRGIAPNGIPALPNTEFLMEWDPLEVPMHT
jgi:hypothetical protein